MISPIRVYAPNLERHTDRKDSLFGQFEERIEFLLTIVPAIERKNGAWGLWQTFYSIVEKEHSANTPYFIFCEDDHTFTEYYDYATLCKSIEQADMLEADLLSGGMSWVKNPVAICKGLFRVSSFTGMQFTIVFNRFYDAILNAKTDEGYVTDVFLSSLAKRMFVIYPYISVQQDFGYSDVTSRNNEPGRVPALFCNVQNWMNKIAKVYDFYTAIKNNAALQLQYFNPENCYIPTYVINLPQRADRWQHIQKQFARHEEFRMQLTKAVEHPVGAVGLWHSICKIIEDAEAKGEDLVLICEDDHVFTEHYDRKRFMQQVYIAGCLGTNLLMGGIGGFGDMQPVGNDLYWVDWCWCTQFMVVYRNAFRMILEAQFRENDVADEFISRLCPNKLVVYPFISVQKDFGYSDATPANKNGGIEQFFQKAAKKAAYYADSATLSAQRP